MPFSLFCLPKRDGDCIEVDIYGSQPLNVVTEQPDILPQGIQNRVNSLPPPVHMFRNELQHQLNTNNALGESANTLGEKSLTPQFKYP